MSLRTFIKGAALKSSDRKAAIIFIGMTRNFVKED